MHQPLNILFLNPLSDEHISLIQQAAPQSVIQTCKLKEAHQWIDHTHILVAWGMMDLRPLFAQASNLQWIHALSAGVEEINQGDIQSSDILLTNSKGIHGIPVSEHVFSYILAFSRSLPQALANQKAKVWQKYDTNEIHGKTLGIVGLGSIGREIAKKAKAFGMKVYAVKREESEELFVDQLFNHDSVDEMLPHCDYVVSALPLTQETEGYFNLERFSKMKPSTYFINIARGGVAVEPDLIESLEKGLIRGAALDVFEIEPLPPTSPLWNLNNVIITPHLGAMSPYYLDRAIKLFADNLSRFINGSEMVNIIDKQKGY